MLDQLARNIDVLDRSPLFRQIVEDARLVTGAGVVVLASFAAADGTITTRASSAAVGDRAGGARSKAVREAVAAFAPERGVTHPHVNAVHEVVYLEGHAVTGPFELVAAGVVSEAAVSAAARTLHLNWTTVQPMLVQGKVAGSISFHCEHAPTDAAIATYEAFARQAALTIENATLFRALQDQLQELREARRLVTASNEAVRREIAERLHGPVQTQLVVADFTLRKASSLIESAPADARQAIADARALLDSVREKEIRDVSHILHPWVIGLGLAPAMRSLVDRFRPVMNVHLDLHPDLEGVGAITAVEISDATRLAAYRIVEEGLANAHKHGQANCVSVSLNVSASEQLVVRVCDDGGGFSEDARPGLGLRLIALKVEEVRGSWAIGRGDAGGASLTAVLPLDGGTLAGAEGRLELSTR